MTMSFVTLTLNPAVDVSTATRGVVPSHKLRCHDVRHEAGGGGINVARVLRRLGADPRAVFSSGGPIGRYLEQLVEREGIPFTAVPVAGDTREDFAIFDENDRAQYRFVLPGPELSASEIDACIAATVRGVERTGFVVASGSLPPAAPGDTYKRVAQALPPGARFVLDTSGNALALALGPRVTLIKPSQRELAELVGAQVPDRAACTTAARNIVDSGRSEMVAVSLGEEGALFIGKGFAFDALAPAVEPATTVGAGDSFLAVLVWSLAQAWSPDKALRWATAAGAAALTTPGTGLCQPDDVRRLAERVAVRAI